MLHVLTNWKRCFAEWWPLRATVDRVKQQLTSVRHFFSSHAYTEVQTLSKSKACHEYLLFSNNQAMFMQLLLAHSLTAQMTDTFSEAINHHHHHALSGLNINNWYKSICVMWSCNIIDTSYYCVSPVPPNNFKKQAPCTVYSISINYLSLSLYHQ